MNGTKDQEYNHEIWVDAKMYEDEEKPQKGTINVKACLKCGVVLDDM